MKRYTITGEWQGSRLDRFIRASMPGMPFGVIQILMRKGLIYLNDERAAGNVRLNDGDIVAINISEVVENGRAEMPAPRRPRIAGVIGKDIPIIFEDDSILVINKPAGLVVQPGNRKEKGSLLDLLEDYRRRQVAARRRKTSREKGREREATSGRRAPHEGEHPDLTPAPASRAEEHPFRYAPIHRIDRQTSGLLVIAKTRVAARALSRSIAEGKFIKTYLAIVEGVPPRRRGIIETPLITHKGKRSHSIPEPGGKGAATRYALINTLPDGRAVLVVTIRAGGRTHQIRAHLASIGRPIVGDTEYGARTGAAGGRIMLHAWRITYRHPGTKKAAVAIAPPPREFPLKPK